MSIGPVQRYSLRSGLSLLEVVLAIAILGAALSVILNLVYMGSTSASNAQRFSQAQIMCDTIMAEIASGVIQPGSTTGGSIPENPEWIYFVEMENAEHEGLLRVKVTVQQSSSITPNPTPFTLMRLLPDPNYEPPTSLIQ